MIRNLPMLSFKEHPLLKISSRWQECAAEECEEPAVISNSPAIAVRRQLGRWLYPIKNALQRPFVERSLSRLGIPAKTFSRPDVICYGQKGFGYEVFLDRIRRQLGTVRKVLCFGCGTGEELHAVARILKPNEIIGCDYFAYPKAWSTVQRAVTARHDTKVQFGRFDFRRDNVPLCSDADLILSFCVLEHLRDMGACFASLRRFLRPGGRFASLWGPMWYGFSGDHISAELGFENGYQHLLLSSEDYFAYYLKHPRNRATASQQKPTWLELGLHNFATFAEYIASIESHFGAVSFITWQLSQEAFAWARQHPCKWQAILEKYPGIGPLDLVLTGTAVLTQRDERL